ncbi:MAG: AEC family transporter [Desulfamplus sp.]|nr:AEC family transporter [Desulfamplus sp.]
MFMTTVSTIFSAIFQLFLISASAGILVKKGIVSQTQIQSLAAVTINVFLPCLIVSKTITSFDPVKFPLWWTLPLAGTLLVLGGLLFGSLLFRMNKDKMHLLPLASMQNSIYIVLPIGKLLYPEEFDIFALYCFLLTMGLTPLMWSVGKVLLVGAKDVKIKCKDFITPPLIATLISILTVFTGISSFLPEPLMASIDILGQATVPLAIFILGATLGMISLTDMPSLRDILIVATIKFILLPLTVSGILYMSDLYRTMYLFSSLLILQASAPPATNLILIVRNYGGDSQSMSSMMFLQYIFCIFAMPVWLAIWQLLAVN